MSDNEFRLQNDVGGAVAIQFMTREPPEMVQVFHRVGENAVR